VTIHKATFGYDGRAAHVQLPPVDDGVAPLAVAARRSFDSMLLEAATAAGAAHRAERVTSLRFDGSGWDIETRAGRTRADWVIGADGANSLVRRLVSRPFSRRDLSIATGYFVHGASSDTIDIAFEDRPPGYLWSFPRPDHLAVGLCAQADEATAPCLLAGARRWIDAHVPRSSSLERYSWPIPSLTAGALAIEQPAGAGWMLLGDAAGLVDPITREGIFFALRSADLAAAALLAGTNPAAHYGAALRRDIYDELTRAANLKARFFQPRFMGMLVGALERSARIRDVMADLVAGRQTYRGLRRRLLATFELKLMAGLFGR
jgi:flavin-dependent dehydrogenase